MDDEILDRLGALLTIVFIVLCCAGVVILLRR